jgi:hypothetical protein
LRLRAGLHRILLPRARLRSRPVLSLAPLPHLLLRLRAGLRRFLLPRARLLLRAVLSLLLQTAAVLRALCLLAASWRSWAGQHKFGTATRSTVGGSHCGKSQAGSGQQFPSFKPFRGKLLLSVVMSPSLGYPTLLCEEVSAHRSLLREILETRRCFSSLVRIESGSCSSFLVDESGSRVRPGQHFHETVGHLGWLGHGYRLKDST